MFQRIKDREERLQAARDEWESKFSIGECLNSEDRDYLAEKVESIQSDDSEKWLRLKSWLAAKLESAHDHARNSAYDHRPASHHRAIYGH